MERVGGWAGRGDTGAQAYTAILVGFHGFLVGHLLGRLAAGGGGPGLMAKLAHPHLGVLNLGLCLCVREGGACA